MQKNSPNTAHRLFIKFNVISPESTITETFPLYYNYFGEDLAVNVRKRHVTAL